jgi:hypothetical protein
MALNKNAPNAGKTGLDNVSMNLGRGNSNIDLEHINTENKTYFWMTKIACAFAAKANLQKIAMMGFKTTTNLTVSILTKEGTLCLFYNNTPRLMY